MKATRHNGRAGIHGTYNPKHNDRDFDIKNSDHIDDKRVEGNVYWDCYQGYFHQKQGGNRKYTFSEVEKAYYQEHYGHHVYAQNVRNEIARHTERNRTVADILSNKKTCPEESILQLGNIDTSVPASVLAEIASEYFKEFEKCFGSHVHILDWALHLDEATPHIHERHVFDAKNKYGELCPQQEKALEELGFELPDTTKPKGRYNNRKMTFDAKCRQMFLNICKAHGIEVDMEPVYGGNSYLEKADYIISKLREEKERLNEENQKLQLTHDELVLKVSDLDSLVEEVSTVAYDKACEVLTTEIATQVRKEDIEEIEKAKKYISSTEVKVSAEKKSFAIKMLSAVQNKINKVADRVLGVVKNVLAQPQKRKAITEDIASLAKPSIRKRLAENLKLVEEQKSSTMVDPNHKKVRTIEAER